MGAEFLEAKVGGFLSQLLEREERESEMASHLVAPLFQAENSPLVLFNSTCLNVVDWLLVYPSHTG